MHKLSLKHIEHGFSQQAHIEHGFSISSQGSKPEWEVKKKKETYSFYV